MKSFLYQRERKYFAITRRWFLRRIFKRFGLHRSRDLIQKDYNRVWAASRDNFNKAMEEPTIRELSGELVLWRFIDVRKFRITYIHRALRELGGVKSVLELGSGDGFNILALAVLHPDITVWRGVELTSAGVAASRQLLERPPLEYLRYVTALEPEVISERLAQSDIQFQQGDILRLPFDDGSFDAVFSSQVIEQLPRDYLRAFREAARVTAKYALFLEEFREAQKNIFHLMHLSNVDYFCASFREVERAGLKVLKFEPFPLRTLYLSIGLVVCAKS